MGKRFYNYLINDCISILVREDYDNYINSKQLFVNYTILLLLYGKSAFDVDYMAIIDAANSSIQ